MPQMPIRRKAKRTTVLTKRTQYLKKYYKERSHRPLFEKLKNNNSYLAKALSKEKQNCQSLFSQNIALIAEVQELRLACNTRDNIISNVLNNAKEVLKMLVTMSGYMTNTISICQEFTAKDTNLRLSSVSVGRKESSRRLSTKSPARGVVKPMVSGHTITKPTINLSRVNMQHINNPSRLSDIQEDSSANRSQEINEARSPIAVSIPITQLRYENDRTCRMPERLTVSSPRVNIDNELRLKRKRSYHSKRISGSYSRSMSDRSERWSGEIARSSMEYTNQLGSPRVKLNDVSKLLQNSQSINIRKLVNNRINDIEIQENSDDAPHDTSDTNITIPDTQVSINPDEIEEETYAQASGRDINAQSTSKKISNKELDRNPNISETVALRPSQANAVGWEDPLEGPSWLFNNTLPSQNNESQSDHADVSDTNTRTPQSNSKVTAYEDESSDLEYIEEEWSPRSNSTKSMSDTQTPKTDLPSDRIADDSFCEDADGSFCSLLPTAAMSNRERNFNNAENDGTTNFARFVTMRRGSENLEEDTEDFTLMLSRHRNMHFDINELRLPVLEGSVINSTITNEIDTEPTITMQRITNIQMPSMSDQNTNELDLDPTATIKLPLILNNDDDRMSTPEKSRHSNQKNKKTKLSNSKGSTNHAEKHTVIVKNKMKGRNKSENNQDPSAVKVVLEKLNESRVKLRTPSPDDTRSRSINNHMRNTTSNHEESLRDMENNSSNLSNNCNVNRPRRRKAPLNMKEPSVKTKLRRE